MTDKDFLQKAIKLSKKSVKQGGFPVGALVVVDGEVAGEGVSDGKNVKDATSHAEIDAIRKASQQLDKRDLNGAVVYSSMEPCLMCFSACYWARIDKVVYAIPKTSLPKEHYEGLHSLRSINQDNNKQIEIVYLKGLEDEAMSVVKNWETS